jgi:plastocyanin
MRLGLINATFTKVGFAGLALALLIPIIPRAIGETKHPGSYSVYNVTGYVRLVHRYSAEILKDSSEVVAWLVPIETVQKVPLKTELSHYQIIQHHKTFEPRLLVVPVGSIVEFPNHDPWFHNVFSESRTGRFDLGLYEAGAEKTVLFGRAGTSYLFCSIHPEMMAIVLSVDSRYFGVSDGTGHISIGNVPPGKYFLHVWYENATPQALEALQRIIFVGDENRSLPAISIALAIRTPIAGKNEKLRSSHFSGGGDDSTELARHF